MYRQRIFSVVLFVLGLVLFILTLTPQQTVYGATVPVDTTADDNIVNGNCTLREAILAIRFRTKKDKCPAGNGSNDTITFSSNVTGTITLTGGKLLIDVNMRIIGPGPAILAISGNSASRIFQVDVGAVVTITNLTIRNGFVADGSGGGILNSGTLAIDNCRITNNISPDGSGIFTESQLTITNSSIFSNGDVNIGYAGGIDADVDTLTISNSTIAFNNAVNVGGLSHTIVNGQGLTNVTVSNNTATYNGGGLFYRGNITNSTIANNSLEVEQYGGGIDAYGVVFKNTIIANNTAASGITANCGLHALGDVDNGNNLEFPGNTCSFNKATDIHADPRLGILQNNGGPTSTMALSAGSPAVDTGMSTGCPSTDQRGFGRVGNCDIGAYEDQSRRYVVNVLLDHPADGICGTGTTPPNDCALRDAIALQQQNGGIVTFASGLTGTITLTQRELTINNGATINGPGANILSISGNNIDRTFLINSGDVTIRDLTLTDGIDTTGGNHGGALYVASGTTRIDRCTITRSNASNGGGGIWNAGTLIITKSTINDNGFNLTTSAGGGIDNEFGGSIIIDNSTIAYNQATQLGGGIWNGGTGLSTITNSTIAFNQAVSPGGGISKASFAPLGLKAVIVANNIPSNCSSSVTDNDYNLDSTDTCFSPHAPHTLYSTNPQLDTTLRYNGGTTQTLALFETSPAKDHGIPNTAIDYPTNDQRNILRSAVADIGAYEVNGTQPPLSAPGPVSTSVPLASTSISPVQQSTRLAPTFMPPKKK